MSDEPSWEELTKPENEPDWDDLREERDVANMFQGGPNVFYERRGFYSKEFAEGMKEGEPRIYYNWSWTPDNPDYPWRGGE